jgi:hypothetical protein
MLLALQPNVLNPQMAPLAASCVNWVRIRVLHGQALARVDTQVRPSIDPSERLVGGHRCAPEGRRKTVTHTRVD